MKRIELLMGQCNFPMDQPLLVNGFKVIIKEPQKQMAKIQRAIYVVSDF